MRSLGSYLVLPPEISAFERVYLARMTRIGLWFFYAHLPVMIVVALLALFAEGLSTRDEATETSGRGIGMSAVAAECHELGGSVDVRSVAGRGTTVTITLPRRVLRSRFVDILPASRDALRVSA